MVNFDNIVSLKETKKDITVEPCNNAHLVYMTLLNMVDPKFPIPGFAGTY